MPVVSSAQMLDWLDGRNGSSFEDVGLQRQRAAELLGRPRARRRAASRRCCPRAPPPARSQSLPRGGAARHARHAHRQGRGLRGLQGRRRRLRGHLRDRQRGARDLERHRHRRRRRPRHGRPGRPTSPRARAWTTAARPRSASQVSDSARVTEHRVELTGLSPSTTYRYRVTSADAAGQLRLLAAGAAAPATFQTPPGALVDDRTSEFAAGSGSGTLRGRQPRRKRRRGAAQPDGRRGVRGRHAARGWLANPWDTGGFATAASGALSLDGSAAFTNAFYLGPRVLEFSATFSRSTTRPWASATTSATSRSPSSARATTATPFQMYAQSGGGTTAPSS